MYQHNRELKYVAYGKVKGNIQGGDLGFQGAYRWLGYYCGFYPQVWLARGQSSITGYREKSGIDVVLFEFDYIKGFDVDYNEWHNVMDALIDKNGNFNYLEKLVRESVDEAMEWDKKEGLRESERIIQAGSYEEWRDRRLFKENDQVVVRSLNLKSAKKVICSNERIKKKLRRIGFIEDRIKIMNLK